MMLSSASPGRLTSRPTLVRSRTPPTATLGRGVFRRGPVERTTARRRCRLGAPGRPPQQHTARWPVRLSSRGTRSGNRATVPIQPPRDVGQRGRVYRLAGACRGREAQAGRTVQAPRGLQRFQGGGGQRYSMLAAAPCGRLGCAIPPPPGRSRSTSPCRPRWTSNAAQTSASGSAAWCFFALRAEGNAARMPSATLNSRYSRATAHASAPRIHPCSLDPVARLSAMTGARMTITSARRIWSRRRSRMGPQYRSRARRPFSVPSPFHLAAASTRSHAVPNVGTRNGRRATVGSPPRRASWRLAVGEGCRARLGEPDVRIPAEPEVAALAVDGQPLHPVATAAAGLHDEEKRSPVTVTSCLSVQGVDHARLPGNAGDHPALLADAQPRIDPVHLGRVRCDHRVDEQALEGMVHVPVVVQVLMVTESSL